MLSLIYVSRLLIDPGDRDRELADIQAVSIARNSGLDITGLLVASPDFFAQLLEGPAEHVDAVMASILADPRHKDVEVVRRSTTTARRFPRWRMACIDTADFGGTAITGLLSDVHAQKGGEALRRLDRLMEAIASNGGAKPRTAR